MASASQNLSGYAGTRLQLDVNVASQDYGANTTTFSWQLYLAGNYAGSSSSSSNTNWNIQQPAGSAFNSGNYGSYSVTGTNSVLIASGTRTVGNAVDGTLTTSFAGYVSVFAGTANPSLSITAPQIPRYATITSISSSAITDVSFNINFSTDAVCDRYAISLDNGSTWGAWVNGDFTSISVSAGSALASNTTYSWKVKVRRKDSQLETVSGTQTATTLNQSNFAVWGIL